jgi:hypothetical protein
VKNNTFHQTTNRIGWGRIAAAGLCIALLTLVMSLPCMAQLGTLAEPFPSPASNAALHYQRAMIQLNKLDRARTSLLDAPVWESLPNPVNQTVSRELASLLYRGRFAIRSATQGTRTNNCDFGIDFGESGAATQLPHLDGMIQLGRLLTLRGSLAEARGDWEEAAIIYFDGLRMGRHLTHQNTLLEALAGIEILRNNYVALSRWSTRCPSQKLVARAFGLLESLQGSLVNPSQILAREGSVMALGFQHLSDAYPEGDWARMILESYGEPTTGNVDEDQASAKRACIKRGVPGEVFEDADAFHHYVDKLSATANRYIEAIAACATLPRSAWNKRGQRLAEKYSKLITILGADTIIDPVEVGTLFSEHEAELAITRLALAVAASRRDDKFPESLKEVAGRFGGELPANPYEESDIVYQTDGSVFSLEIAAVGGLPRVSVSSHAPMPPGK